MSAAIADHALDLQVHALVFGGRILTHEEMAAEAEKVWKKQPSCSSFLMGFFATGPDTFEQRVPWYSMDIAAAWLVVEKMRVDGYGFDLSSIEIDGGWSVLFDSQRTAFAGTTRRAPTAALAICLAALACADAVRPASEPAGSVEARD